MRTEVYPKGNEHAQRAEGENRIELSDSEKLWLRDALDDQMTTLKISGLERQVTHIIYRQTIGYNKRSDDLTGTRVHKLLGEKSRYDYCLKTLRSLIEQNILIASKGHYGKIYAINYNFEQWQQELSDDAELISDPEAFVQANFKPEDAQEEHKNPDSYALCNNPVSNTPALQDHSLNKAKGEKAEESKPYETCSTPSERHAHEAPKSDAIMAYVLTECDFGNARNEADFGRKQDQAETEATAKIIAFEPPSTLKAPENNQDNNDDKRSLSEAEINQKPALKQALIYPKELKSYEKTAVENVLQKEALEDRSTIQMLLDTLSSRFKISDWEPIRSPIAYFRSLIRSIKNGTFEALYGEIYQQKRQETVEQQQTQQENTLEHSQQKKYQKARNCYESTKLYAGILQCSLREVAKKRGWENLLDEMGFDLDTAT